MNNSIDTNALLVQLRAMAEDAGIPPSQALNAEDTTAANAVDFSSMLENSLQSVNARGAEAKELRESFEAGTPNVELSDVMVAAQKARISFEALTQVRNKMVSAYQEIMRMPL